VHHCAARSRHGSHSPQCRHWPLDSAKAINSSVAMRAGRSWLRWTGPAASGPESRTPGVDCGGGLWQSNESNRIESFYFLPNRPSLLYSGKAMERSVGKCTGEWKWLVKCGRHLPLIDQTGHSVTH